VRPWFLESVNAFIAPNDPEYDAAGTAADPGLFLGSTFLKRQQMEQQRTASKGAPVSS